MEPNFDPKASFGILQNLEDDKNFKKNQKRNLKNWGVQMLLLKLEEEKIRKEEEIISLINSIDRSCSINMTNRLFDPNNPDGIYTFFQ